MNMKPRIIAFYLPQFHPTPDNNQWWGKGFTEWTNVGKAKPLFRGHYQPRVPADLGYYDLRLPESRAAQAELAKEAGIEGFCYYHYWFGDGKRELELPFNEVLRTGDPDFPFCLCWANESWHAKFWNKDGKASSKKLLIEQQYLGHEDNVKHFYSLLPAFRDNRYIKVDGKLLFMIYRPFEFVGMREFIDDWRKLAEENGLPGFHFVAQLSGTILDDLEFKSLEPALSFGFDAFNTVRLFQAYAAQRSFFVKVKQKLTRIFRGVPNIYDYKDLYPYFISGLDKRDDFYPTIIPNWDHSPRSGRVANIVHKSTPALFKAHVHEVFDLVSKKTYGNPIVFLKSWNEWGEGNYMEPDLRWGKKYIEALREEVNAYTLGH